MKSCSRAMQLEALPSLLPVLPTLCSLAAVLRAASSRWGTQLRLGTFQLHTCWSQDVQDRSNKRVNAVSSCLADRKLPTPWKLLPCCSQGVGGWDKQHESWYSSQRPGPVMGAGKPPSLLICYQSHLDYAGMGGGGVVMAHRLKGLMALD